MTLNELFLDYLAGFIDAEGCLSVTKSQAWNRSRITHSGSFAIGLINRSLLEIICHQIGGSITNRKLIWNDKRQPSYLFRLTGPKLLGILTLLKDRLIVKRSQAILLSSLLKTKHNIRKGVPLNPKIVKMRESIACKIKKIKKRDYDLEISSELKCRENLDNLLPSELAYIAGFLDGDGRIAIRGGENSQLVMVIDNTNPQVLQWIQSKIGGSLLKYKRRKENKLQPYRLYIPRDIALRVIPKLIPYLILKHEISKVCFQFKIQKDIATKKNLFKSYREIFDNQGSFDCWNSLKYTAYYKEK